jgi:hypothetical protein
VLNSHNLFIFSPCLLTAWSQKELPEDSRCPVAGRVLVDLESCTAGGRHLTERQVRDALEQFDAVWGDVFVPVGNSRSDMLVVQAAQNWHGQRLTDGLDGAGDRRVLLQR